MNKQTKAFVCNVFGTMCISFAIISFPYDFYINNYQCAMIYDEKYHLVYSLVMFLMSTIAYVIGSHYAKKQEDLI